MTDPITEVDTILTAAIQDMSFNPWQGAEDRPSFETASQAYHEQRAYWLEVLNTREPASVSIFAENYPPRTEVITSGTFSRETADRIKAGHVGGLSFQAPKIENSRAPHKREEILDTAKSLIVGDREADYGRPIDSFTRVAAAFNIVLEGLGHPPITATDAAKLMIALKFSRLSGGDNKDDTWIDLAGYAALGAEVFNS